MKRDDQSETPEGFPDPPATTPLGKAQLRQRSRELLTTILKDATPPELRVVGRTLYHAAMVGLAAGLMGAGFFATLEFVQRLLLENLGGYRPLRASGETFMGELGHVQPLPAVARRPAPRRRRADRRHLLAAGARDLRRRRRRDDQRLSSRRRTDPQARLVGQGAVVDLHAGDRRLRRARGADDADRRRAGLAVRALAARRRARAPHPDGVGRRGRHRGGVPDAARRRVAGGRGPLPRRLRIGRADPGGPGQRDRVLGRHLDLRRVDAVRAPGPVPVRHHAPVAVRAAGADGVRAGGHVPGRPARRSAHHRRTDDPHVGAPGPGRAGDGRLLRPDRGLHRVAPGAAGARAGPLRRRLRRRSGGDHGRQLVAGRLGGRRPAAVSVPGQDRRLLADDRQRGQRRRFRARRW